MSVGKNNVNPGAPYTNMQSWPDAYPGVNLFINANFFDVEDALHPYTTGCTNAFGLTVSNGVVVSPAGGVPNHNTTATDTLIFFTSAYAASVGQYASIESGVIAGDTRIGNAISGYRMLNAGVFQTQPSAITPNVPRPRAAAGLMADKKTLIVMAINPGEDDQGTTISGMATYVKALGAVDALTLDGSGSSQLFHRPSATRTNASDTLTCGTASCAGGPFYRPVPVFVGFN